MGGHLLGGFHCVSSLFFRQTIEQQTGAVRKSSDQTPRREKFFVFHAKPHFVRENVSKKRVFVIELNFLKLES